MFDEEEKPGKDEFVAAFEDIQTDCEERGFDLIEVASGWRFQVSQDLSKWVGRLWEEKPQKYSRAMLETLSLVAYRQPITRGDIEQIRGVAVSSHIMKGLIERDWVKVVGHRDVPGRPAMYATTKEFLDYFNLKSLEELPTLAEIRDLDSLNQELNLDVAVPPASLELKEDETDETVNENNESQVDGDDVGEASDLNEDNQASEDESVLEEDIQEESELDTDMLSDENIEPVDTEKENSNIE